MIDWYDIKWIADAPEFTPINSGGGVCPDRNFCLFFGGTTPYVVVELDGVHANKNVIQQHCFPLEQEHLRGGYSTNTFICPELKLLVYTNKRELVIYFVPLVNNQDKLVNVIDAIYEACKPAGVLEEEQKFSIIVSSQFNGLTLKTVPCKPYKIYNDDFKLFYGEDFPLDEILQFPDSDDGLMLFHGDPGTGKTNFLKNLIKKYKKDVIYLPSPTLALASSPDFLPFLLRQSGKILLLEDADSILSSERNIATENLLNLTDGFLKDVYDIKVIATFNTNIKNVDSALLRDGRLHLEHRFRKLSAAEANKLSDVCNLGKKFSAEQTLAQIFAKNTKETSFEPRFIGFST